MQTKISPKNNPYLLKVKKGEKYAWCSCSLSLKQPLCDGSHKNTNYKPLVINSKKNESIYLCGCKKTKKPPFCDGTHNKL